MSEAARVYRNLERRQTLAGLEPPEAVLWLSSVYLFGLVPSFLAALLVIAGLYVALRVMRARVPRGYIAMAVRHATRQARHENYFSAAERDLAGRFYPPREARAARKDVQ